MTNEIWTFKYEPKTIEEMVIPDEMISILNGIIKRQPNILLSGSSGIGKGTFVNIMLNNLKSDYIKINASKDNSIDDVRDKITSFATSMSINKKIKYVYLNEFDFFSQAGQASLRDVLESVQSITRFILTCNYPNKIIDALKSRCECIEFPSPPLTKLGKFCLNILSKENIKEIDKKLLATIIKSHTPDIRRIINTIQLNCVDNKLIKLYDINSDKSNTIILDGILKSDLEIIRKTLRSNSIDYNELYEFLYNKISDFKAPGDAIILIAESLRDNNYSSNKEINFMGMVCKGLKNGVF